MVQVVGRRGNGWIALTFHWHDELHAVLVEQRTLAFSRDSTGHYDFKTAAGDSPLRNAHAVQIHVLTPAQIAAQPRNFDFENRASWELFTEDLSTL